MDKNFKVLLEVYEDSQVQRMTDGTLTIPLKMSLLIVEIMSIGLSKDAAVAQFDNLWDHVETNRKGVKQKMRAELEALSKKDIG